MNKLGQASACKTEKALEVENLNTYVDCNTSIRVYIEGMVYLNKLWKEWYEDIWIVDAYEYLYKKMTHLKSRR